MPITRKSLSGSEGRARSSLSISPHKSKTWFWVELFHLWLEQELIMLVYFKVTTKQSYKYWMKQMEMRLKKKQKRYFAVVAVALSKTLFGNRLVSVSPILDISGTVAWYGPSGNLGSLSLISWILTMNSDSGSRGLSVSRFRAWARRTYWALTSRSSLWMAWMSPVLSSMVKVEPAPSPVRMYLMEPSPLSMSEWSCGCTQLRIQTKNQ